MKVDDAPLATPKLSCDDAPLATPKLSCDAALMIRIGMFS